MQKPMHVRNAARARKSSNFPAIGAGCFLNGKRSDLAYYFLSSNCPYPSEYASKNDASQLELESIECPLRVRLRVAACSRSQLIAHSHTLLWTRQHSQVPVQVHVNGRNQHLVLGLGLHRAWSVDGVRISLTCFCSMVRSACSCLVSFHSYSIRLVDGLDDAGTISSLFSSEIVTA